MDDNTKNYIEIVVYTYIIRIICVVGILGNTAILVVLSRREVTETAFVYVKALAGVDLIICVMLLGMGFVRCGDCSEGLEQRYYARVYEAFFYLPIANAGQMVNLFITIAMAVHRSISVVQMRRSSDSYSLRIDVLKSRNIAKCLVTTIIAFSIAANAIRFFFYVIKRCYDPAASSEIITQQTDGNSSLYGTEVTDRMTSPDLLWLTWKSAMVSTPKSSDTAAVVTQEPSTDDMRRTTIYSSLNTCMPISDNLAALRPHNIRYILERTDFQRKVNESFLLALSSLHFCELITLTTVNVILIRVLRRSKSQRKSLIRAEVQSRKKRDDVTRMLVVMVVVHIVCHLHSPFSADPIAQLIFGSHYIQSNEYQFQLALNNTLTLTSHAITFFLYLVCNKFRRQVKRTWRQLTKRFLPHSSASSSPLNSGWTPSFTKGGASPILARNHSTVTLRYL